MMAGWSLAPAILRKEPVYLYVGRASCGGQLLGLPGMWALASPWPQCCAELGTGGVALRLCPSQRTPCEKPELCVACGTCEDIAALTAFSCILCLETVLPISLASYGEMLMSGYFSIYLYGVVKARAPSGQGGQLGLLSPHWGVWGFDLRAHHTRSTQMV